MYKTVTISHIASFDIMTLSRKQQKQLQLLSVCPIKQRKELLQKIPISCIKAICECSLNTLKGNISLSKQQKTHLRKHKLTLRKLAHKKLPLYQKRKLIIQRGGFLNWLIPAALTTISTLLNGAR